MVHYGGDGHYNNNNNNNYNSDISVYRYLRANARVYNMLGRVLVSD